MSDKKLTPRVGDRVLFKIDGVTNVGNVSHLDGEWADVDSSYTYPLDDLTVVDRDPVEWPEGWSEYDSDDGTAYSNYANVVIRKNELAQLLATGPDMLARWDELMAGGE